MESRFLDLWIFEGYDWKWDWAVMLYATYYLLALAPGDLVSHRIGFMVSNCIAQL